MKSCLPPDVAKIAKAAERRKDAAVDRILLKLKGVSDDLPMGDEFEAEMRRILGTDNEDKQTGA